MNLRNLLENEHFKSAVIAIIFVGIMVGSLFFMDSIGFHPGTLFRMCIYLVFAVGYGLYYQHKFK